MTECRRSGAPIRRRRRSTSAAPPTGRKRPRTHARPNTNIVQPRGSRPAPSTPTLTPTLIPTPTQTSDSASSVAAPSPASATVSALERKDSPGSAAAVSGSVSGAVYAGEFRRLQDYVAQLTKALDAFAPLLPHLRPHLQHHIQPEPHPEPHPQSMSSSSSSSSTGAGAAADDGGPTAACSHQCGSERYRGDGDEKRCPPTAAMTTTTTTTTITIRTTTTAAAPPNRGPNNPNNPNSPVHTTATSPPPPYKTADSEVEDGDAVVGRADTPRPFCMGPPPPPKRPTKPSDPKTAVNPVGRRESIGSCNSAVRPTKPTVGQVSKPDATIGQVSTWHTAGGRTPAGQATLERPVTGERGWVGGRGAWRYRVWSDAELQGRIDARRPSAGYGANDWWRVLSARLWPEDVPLDGPRRAPLSEYGKRVVGEKDTEVARRQEARLTYGELTAAGVRQLLGPDYVAADGGGLLLDLGAGLGKLVVQAWAEGWVRRAVGVELAPARAAINQRALQHLDNIANHPTTDTSPSTLAPTTTTATHASGDAKWGDGGKGVLTAFSGSGHHCLRLSVRPNGGSGAVREVEMREGNLLEVSDELIGEADVVLLAVDLPASVNVRLAWLLSKMRIGARLVTYRELSPDIYPSTAYSPFQRVFVGARFSTTWAPNGFNFPVYRRVAQTWIAPTPTPTPTPTPVKTEPKPRDPSAPTIKIESVSEMGRTSWGPSWCLGSGWSSDDEPTSPPRRRGLRWDDDTGVSGSNDSDDEQGWGADGDDPWHRDVQDLDEQLEAATDPDDPWNNVGDDPTPDPAPDPTPNTRGIYAPAPVLLCTILQDGRTPSPQSLVPSDPLAATPQPVEGLARSWDIPFAATWH